MASQSKPTPQPVKHAGHHWMLVRGNWGPHTAKYVCRECEGEFVKWVSTKRKTHG